MDETIIRLLREKEDHIHQLELDLKRCTSKNSMMEELAQDAEEDAKRIRDEFTEFKKNVGSQSEGSMRKLRDTINQLEGDLAESLATRDSMQSSINRLEKLLEDERKTKTIDESFHPDETLSTAHEDEIKSLREELEEACQWKMAMDHKVILLERQLMESNERADDAMQEGNMLRRNLNEARDQLKNLEFELNSVKHNQHFASKGNSMFSEFVDERKKLESDMETLNVENLSLRQENRTLMAEIEELSLQKGNGEGRIVRCPCKCEDLEKELLETRIERDRAVQQCRHNMNEAVTMFQLEGNLEGAQKRRVHELREDVRRGFVENDRLKRQIRSIKDELMNARVDMLTWKKTSEKNSRELEKTNELLIALRKKHSVMARPASNPTTTIASMRKMCTENGEAADLPPQTPAAAARPSSFSSSHLSSYASCSTSRTSRGRLPVVHSTPATGAMKRPAEDPEMRLKQMLDMERRAREAEKSLNTSVPFKPLNTSSMRKGPVHKKPRFLSNIVKTEAPAALVIERTKIEEKEEERGRRENSLEMKLRDATPPDENEEKSNLPTKNKTIEEVKSRVWKEEEEVEDVRENHDPSFIMSKERAPGDTNLEATVLEESMIN